MQSIERGAEMPLFFMEISKEQSTALKEVVEDAVEYICDSELLSGETAWTVVECIAIAKQEQLKGNIT